MAREDTQFKKGQSGNPAGRPKGSVSIKTEIKKKFQENPKFFESYIADILADEKLRKVVWEMLEGKPHQTNEHTGDVGLNITFDNAFASKTEGDSKE